MSQTTDTPRREEETRPLRPGLIERLRHVFGLQTPSIREELEEALDDEPRDASDLSPQERAILRNVLTLHEHRVRDIMVPRADIIAIGITATLAEVLSLFRTAGHSRLPVHGETLDDPRGMVHIRDLVDYLAARAEEEGRRRRESSDTPVDGAERARRARYVSTEIIDLAVTLMATGIVRPVLFIPPSMPALDLLVRMQATRTHMALVIDEYGGTDGLVSIEDVVEVVVGDIEDEHDDIEPTPIVRNGDGDYTVDARASLADVRSETGWAVTEADERPDVDTVGGFVASIAGRVPTRGEIVVDKRAGLEFEILEADPRRVKSVRLRQTALTPETATDAAGTPPAAET